MTDGAGRWRPWSRPEPTTTLPRPKLSSARSTSRPGPGWLHARPDQVVANRGYSAARSVPNCADAASRRSSLTDRPDQRSYPPGREPVPARPGRLRAPQRRRALLQQAQAQQGPGHPLRQTRPPLRSHAHPRMPTTLAPLSLRTQPSSAWSGRYQLCHVVVTRGAGAGPDREE